MFAITRGKIVFENVLLEQEQKDLLAALVEAARNVPRNWRKPFSFRECQSDSWIEHPGLPDKTLDAYKGDIETLAREGLLALSYGSRAQISGFDVTPQGFAYYEWMKQRAGQPIQNVETTIRDYLDADHFQQKYPKACQKWAEAESMLWASDSEHQLTTIGHLCREATQEFATALVEQHQPPDVDKDKAHTVARISVVLDLRKSQLGSKEKPFLDALLAYWRTVNDLIQRQEHGGKKEGEPLVWEDGRRVVFQTAVAMFEIDRAISRAR
jgi:hypothetical protein